MREYGVVYTRFWNGETGKKIRAAGEDAQRLALYLLTSPSSNMLGLYYVTLPSICHEIAGFDEQRCRAAFQALDQADRFAYYDYDREFVWVPKMALFQVGKRLTEHDKRRAGICKELRTLSPLVPQLAVRFYARYRESYNLDVDGVLYEQMRELVKGLPRGMQGAHTNGSDPDPVPDPDLELDLFGERGVGGRGRPHRIGVRTYLPDDLQLTNAMRGAIEAAGCTDPEAAFQAFCDKHRMKKNRYSDWEGAVWRTWVGYHGKYGCPCEKTGTGNATTADNVRLVAARMRAQRAAGGGG